MNILVTGATGCLGGVTARRLAAAGHAVTGTGRDRAKGTDLSADGVRFVPADLADRPTMETLAARHAVIIHAGGLSSAWGRREDFMRANVGPTRTLIQVARDAGSRFIFISSPSIYFDFTNRYAIDSDAAPAARPVNAYAESKLVAEGLVRDASQFGLDAAIIRPRAIFGANDTALMPRLLRAAARGRIPLIDGGRALLDMTYVDNVADALIAASLHPAPLRGRAYNISNGEPIAVADLMRAVVDGLGLKVRFMPIGFPLAYAAAAAMEAAANLRPSRPEPVLTRYTAGVLGKSQTLSIDRAKSELGWAPRVRLWDGIERTLSAWRTSHA
jgi:nucleoside-diphosphate-sugar epimerase